MGAATLVELRLQGIVPGGTDFVGCRAYRFGNDATLLLVETQKALNDSHLYIIKAVALGKLRQE